MSAHGTGAYAPHRSDNPVIRAVGMLSSVCGWVAAGMIVVSVGITCQMIFVRFVLRQSTIWQTEAVIYLMIAATLIGLPYVQRLRGHVNVDLLPLLLPGAARRALAYLVMAASLAIIGVMLFYGYEMWHMAFQRGWRSDTVWGVRLWIPYLAVPVGLGLLMLQIAADMLALATDEETPFGLKEDETLAGMAPASAAPAAPPAHDMADATTGEPGASPEIADIARFAPAAPGAGSRFSDLRRTRAPREGSGRAPRDGFEGGPRDGGNGRGGAA